MSKIKIWRVNLNTPVMLKVLAVFSVAAAGLFFWSWNSSGANRDFAQADDFPRGALVYAQAKDLPALLKIWNESELKKRYLDSTNFRQFQNRHLALKLAARWQEFNDALGFEIDANAIASVTENWAAIAIYDIGKMEMVFVAPASAEKFAATMFFQKQNDFESIELADGTIYYSRDVEADRGRQRQKILFANLKGRFVLATSENLLLRTLANVNRKTQKDRLSDEPNFGLLGKRIAPHLLTVWVDQAKLNEDWYFKRYWIMRNIAPLKTIRAGIFDFEMTDDKLIERREFLRAENEESTARKISAEENARLQSLIPAEAPFFRLQTVAGKPQQAASLLRDAILDRLPAAKTTKGSERWSGYDSFDDSADYRDSESYYYLDSKFDEFIDEEVEAETISNDDQRGSKVANLENNLRQILAGAQISAAAVVAQPRALEAPLFIQFQKAAIFYLNSPEKLDRQALENAISPVVANDLSVANEKLNLSWSSGQSGAANSTWRELKFPALNREICYAARDNLLIVANSAGFLKLLLNGNNVPSPAELSESFDELRVIRLDQRAAAFDAPMNALFNAENKQQLPSKNAAADTDFFTGNVGSLLTAISQAQQIEIKRNGNSKFLSEEIVVTSR